MKPNIQENLLPGKEAVASTLENIPDSSAHPDEEQSLTRQGSKRGSFPHLLLLTASGADLSKRNASGADLSKRQSQASLGWKQSRSSFATIDGMPNMGPRKSIASIKQTMSKINLALHPEKGSFIAQSMASLPIPAKVYIITQVLAAFSVSIGMMAVGFTAGWTSPAIESIKREWNATAGATWGSTMNNLTDGAIEYAELGSLFTLNEDQESWVGSLMPFFALVGSMVGGYFLDAMGRKMLICVTGPPFVLAYILMGSANGVWMLYVGRCLAGLCVGFLTLSLPVYLSETIQPEIRGTLALLPTTFGNGGILVCFTLGAYLNWWVLAYIGAIIPAVFLVMMIFVPETPRWYISKGREEDAYKSLCWLRGNSADVEAELADIVHNHDQSQEESSTIRDIFSRRYAKPLGIAIILMLFQQFSGINAVIFYSVSIFESAGSTLDSNLCSIIVGVVNLMATLVSTALIDRLGRKILLHMSNSLMIVSLILLTIYFHLQSFTKTEIKDEYWISTVESIGWLPLLSIMMYVTGFSLGWGPIPWLFMGEALPAKIRAPAASIVTAINWSVSFLVTKLFPIMQDLIGATAIFGVFTAVMILATIFCVLVVPETKGMSLEDIEAVMMGRTKPSLHRKMSMISSTDDHNFF